MLLLPLHLLWPNSVICAPPLPQHLSQCKWMSKQSKLVQCSAAVHRCSGCKAFMAPPATEPRVILCFGPQTNEQVLIRSWWSDKVSGSPATQKLKEDDSSLFKIEVYRSHHDTNSPDLIKIRADLCFQKVVCADGQLRYESKEDNQYWTVEYLPCPSGARSISPFNLRSLSHGHYLIMDDNGILTSTNQQPVEHWSWHHAKFIWNGEKRTLVGLGVVGIIGTAIAAGVAAGAGSLIMTSGAASAAAEAGVAFGCVTPFVGAVLGGVSTGLSAGIGGTYEFLCYETQVPKDFLAQMFVYMSGII